MGRNIDLKPVETPSKPKREVKADRLASAITLTLEPPEAVSGLASGPEQIRSTDKQFITLTFNGGTPHIVPWTLCHTWSGMEKFIQVYYAEDKEALEEVSSGKFELRSRGNHGGVIVPAIWEQVVEPKWFVEIWLYSQIAEILPPSPVEGPKEEEQFETTYENRVRYTVSYYQKDRWGEHEEFLGKSTYNQPVDFEVSTDRPKVLPVLEEMKVVTSPWSYEEKPRQHWEESDASKKPKLGQFDKVSETKLQIHSQYLLNVLRSIIDYSAEEPSGDVDSLTDGSFRYPYRDLFYYRSDLKVYKTDLDGRRKKHSEMFNKTCDEHIDILLDYLYTQPTISLREVESLWSRKIPLTTFAGVWLLLKPGSDVYVREPDGSLNVYIIDKVDGGVQDDNSGKRVVQDYSILVWNMALSQFGLNPRSFRVSITIFDNEHEVVKLKVFPTGFIDNHDGGALRAKLRERGKKYFQYAKGPSFLEYDGYGLKPGRKKYTNTRVVVEHASAPWHMAVVESSSSTSINTRWLFDFPDAGPIRSAVRVPKCECKECASSTPDQEVYTPAKFSDWFQIDPKETEELTEHQYLMLGSHMWAFVLKDRQYDLLDVGSLREPRISEKAIDRLVMQETNKDTIKAIAKTYTNDKGQAGRFSADFIHGKGEGQIILLHGPPGTGKTLTAESVAEFAKRPLLSITAADLGHEPDILEKNLLRFFRNANDWDAIVLLDEADVYLERRSISDLRRNSIVSIFLRALDYFQGILFLTTNRVGHFDEAFMARIHVSIGYERLDDKARGKIWDNLFRKLKEDREAGGPVIKYEYEAKEYVQRSSEVKALKWNGREIRNAFQTAVALAVFDSNIAGEKSNGTVVPEVKEAHLQQVVSMSSAFKDYMKSTHEDVDDSDLAFRRGIRNDRFQNLGTE
ncbi:hypothetical protein BDV96DRAFT_500065 [Lophiotrema nucula]|uniref:AAA+ ATPase domain-containing protein n=1 Tax=Lophiotrema nucula TaxID=690887 RepID=A0A6A5YVC9_9PLEO|nr:hypothetical protein BDV96DRAFT_500065 [Lophiotrema nucula]